MLFPASEVGGGVAAAEFYQGRAAEVNGIDAREAGAFNEGGVSVFRGDAAKPGADGVPSGDEGRFAFLVPEAAEISYEDGKGGGGEVRAQASDQGSQLPGVERGKGFMVGVRFALVPEDAREGADPGGDAGTADGINVEGRSGTQGVDGGSAPSGGDETDHGIRHLLAEADGERQGEAEGGAALVQVERMARGAPAGPATRKGGLESALAAKRENAGDGIAVARLPRVLLADAAEAGHIRLAHEQEDPQACGILWECPRPVQSGAGPLAGETGEAGHYTVTLLEPGSAGKLAQRLATSPA